MGNASFPDSKRRENIGAPISQAVAHFSHHPGVRSVYQEIVGALSAASVPPPVASGRRPGRFRRAVLVAVAHPVDYSRRVDLAADLFLSEH